MTRIVRAGLTPKKPLSEWFAFIRRTYTTRNALSAESLDRVNVTRKGDFSPPRPMMWMWGNGSGLRSVAPCPLGSGARPVRNVNRCHWEFAT
jgi:hypothetical protein